MKLSVVLASNRPDGLRLLFRHLEAQTFKDFELIVADAAHTERDLPDTTLNLRHVPVNEPHKCNGCFTYNVGIGAAKGDIVALITDYSMPRADWVERHVAMHDSGRTVFGGLVAFYKVNKRPDDVVDGDLVGLTPNPDRRAENGAAGVADFFCNNISFPREELVSVGGFDETFDDQPFHGFWDTELNYRISKLLPFVWSSGIAMARVQPTKIQTPFRAYSTMEEWNFYSERFADVLRTGRTMARKSCLVKKAVQPCA